MKKTLSILLTVLLLLGTVAAGLSAAAEWEEPETYTLIPLGETVEVSSDEVLKFNTGNASKVVIVFDNEQPLTADLYYLYNPPWHCCTESAARNLILEQGCASNAYYAVELKSETVQTLHVRVCAEEVYAHENARPLALNETGAAVVGPELPAVYLEFAPPESAYYSLVTEGVKVNYEAYALPEWDRVGFGRFEESTDFDRRIMMVAGKTYCVKLYPYYTLSDDQPVTVQIVRTLELVDPAALTLEQNVPLSLTFSESGARQFLKFTPAVTGSYILYESNDASDLGATIYDDGLDYRYADSNLYSPFSCGAALTAGKTYYYQMSGAAGKTYGLTMTTAADYLQMRSVPILLDQALEAAAGDYVTFVPETTGTYIFTAKDGEGNRVDATLYDAERKAIYCDYDLGNGILPQKLDAGSTYYFVPQKAAICNIVTIDAYAQAEGWQTVGENEEIQYIGGENSWYIFVPERSQKYLVGNLNDTQAGVHIHDSDFKRITSMPLDDDGEKPVEMTAGKPYYFYLYHYNTNLTATCSVMTPAAFAQKVAKPITLSAPAEATRYRKNYFAFTPETTDSYTVCVEAPGEYNSILSVAIHDDAMESLTSNSAHTSSITKIADTLVLQAGKTYYFTTDLHYTSYSLTLTVMPTADFMATSAIALTEGVPQHVDQTSPEDLYFAFTPAVSGNYAFTSDAPYYGTLTMYDCEMKKTREAYVNKGIDFEARLEAGKTYYYGIVFNGYSSIQPFEVTVSKVCDHPHTAIEPGVAATCTTDGKSAGIRCTDCGKMLVKQSVLYHRHKDWDHDHVCNVCGQPAIEFTAPCNERGTVTAVYYSDRELILSGAGAITLAPGKPKEKDFDDPDAYENASNKWYDDMGRILTLEIPEGVTSISANSFSSMYFLQSLTLPKTCTHVDSGAFTSNGLISLTVYNPTLKIDGQFSVPGYRFKDAENPPAMTASISRELENLLMTVIYLMGIEDEGLGLGKTLVNTDSVDDETVKAFTQLYLEELKEELMFELGEELDPAEATDDIATLVLRHINDMLFTDFTCAADLFTYDFASLNLVNPTEEDFRQLFSQPTEAFCTALYERYGINIRETGILIVDLVGSSIVLGKQGSYTPYADVLIRGYEGSTVQAAAQITGAPFQALCPTDHAHTHEEGETQPTRSTHGHTAGLFCDDCGEPVTAEVIHNQLGRHKDEVPATTEAPGSVKIQCTVCREWGLYEIPQLEPENPGDTTDPGNNNPGDHTDPAENNNSGSGEGDPSPWENFVNTVKKIVRGPVDVILRLIRWIGRLFG